MSGFTVSPLQESDIEAFVACQFAAFVGNSLHDIVYPKPQHSIDAQRKVFATQSTLPAGNQIIYLKAVDDASGQLVGGIKVCYYGEESVRQTSPYPAGQPVEQDGLSDEDRYQRWVLGEFLERRRTGTMFQHALIDLLFVHPDHGRRGIGQALVGQSCATADSKNLFSIVEASPQGKRTYEKCGFVSREPVTITSERWPRRDDNLYYWMEREVPQSS